MSAKARQATFARDVRAEPIGLALAVDRGENAATVLNTFRELYLNRFRFSRISCGICVRCTGTLDFIKVFGALSRT